MSRPMQVKPAGTDQRSGEHMMLLVKLLTLLLFRGAEEDICWNVE